MFICVRSFVAYFLTFLLILYVQTGRHISRWLSITLIICKRLYIARICQTCLYETQVPDSTPRASFVQSSKNIKPLKEDDEVKSEYPF